MRLKSKITEFTWGLCFKSNIRKMENEADKYWDRDLETKTSTHNHFQMRQRLPIHINQGET